MSLTEFEVWTARGRRPKVKAGRISSSPFSGDDGRRSTGFLGVSSAPQICTEFIEKSFFQGIKDSTVLQTRILPQKAALADRKKKICFLNVR